MFYFILFKISDQYNVHLFVERYIIDQCSTLDTNEKMLHAMLKYFNYKS